MAGSLISNTGATLKNASDGRAVRVCLTGDQIPLPTSAPTELPSGFLPFNLYSEVTSVPASTPTNVLSYTVPVGNKLILKLVEVSGENRSKFQVKIAGSTEATKRVYGPKFNEEFDFEHFEIVAGDTIIVVAEHNRTMVSDYEARILGVLKVL